MDLVPDRFENDYISEYEEAQARFEGTVRNRENNTTQQCDAIVRKLCTGNTESITIGRNSSLFYEIIHRANFLQIKNVVIPKFYSELCHCFILTDIIDDIVENMDRLDNIAHVKILIAQGFLMELQILPIFEDGWLLLKYSEEKKWTEITRSVACNLRVYPSAFKLFFTHRKFKVIHLNFLFRLLEVRNLSLQGCSFIGMNPTKLFRNMSLTFLNLRTCGKEINTMIQENIPGVFQHLIHLNISNNPLHKETLKKLNLLSLKYLNIHNSMKTVPLMQMRVVEGILHLSTSNNALDSNVSVLLNRFGRIGDSLQELDISYNYLTVVNMEKISQLNLSKLDITGCFEYSEALGFSRISFPSKLRELKALRNTFRFDDFLRICSLNLEKFQMWYLANTSDDFSRLCHSPLVESLKELTVYLHNPSEDFISFISKFKLTYFESNFVEPPYTDNILERFIKNHREEKECLRAIDIASNHSISENFILNLRTLNLTEVSIYLQGSSSSFLPILSCANLQESLVLLEIDGQEIEDCDLDEIMKFQKLEYLSFCYSNNIQEEKLGEVVEMMSSKELGLNAIVREKLDINMARLLCIAPPQSLEIYGRKDENVVLWITVEAFQYLWEQENLSRFTSCLTSLLLNSGEMTKELALILRNVSWEKITIDQCTDHRNSLHFIWTSRNVSYTLKSIQITTSVINMEDIFNLRVARLQIDGRNHTPDYVMHVS